MKTLTVRKLDVVSVANFTAVLAGAVALVLVVLSWMTALINFASVEAYFPNVFDWNEGSGFWAILIAPLVNAALGWVGGAVVAVFYNMALGTTSGIKVDVDE